MSSPLRTAQLCSLAPLRTGLLCCLALFGCASPADHFYTLSALPDSVSANSPPSVHLRLQVTIPTVVDRNEMVLRTGGNGVQILDHERWAAPLSDQVTRTLARDIERRRNDILVADRGFDQAAAARLTLKVDIVEMSVRRGGPARIEAHWRLVDAGAGIDELGSGSFEAPVLHDDYASVAEAYSRTLSVLAERLVQDVRRR